MRTNFRKDTENHEGPKFIGYDDFEEAIEEMGLMSKQADLGTLQWQWDLLKPDSYAIRFVGDITIYTEILETYDEEGMKG